MLKQEVATHDVCLNPTSSSNHLLLNHFLSFSSLLTQINLFEIKPDPDAMPEPDAMDNTGPQEKLKLHQIELEQSSSMDSTAVRKRKKNCGCLEESPNHQKVNNPLLHEIVPENEEIATAIGIGDTGSEQDSLSNTIRQMHGRYERIVNKAEEVSRKEDEAVRCGTGVDPTVHVDFIAELLEVSAQESRGHMETLTKLIESRKRNKHLLRKLTDVCEDLVESRFQYHDQEHEETPEFSEQLSKFHAEFLNLKHGIDKLFPRQEMSDLMSGWILDEHEEEVTRERSPATPKTPTRAAVRPSSPQEPPAES